jgi:phosphatidylinositol alpha-mannosyltransferase
MRIALITEFYYPHLGGVTEHVHYLAEEFRRRGHAVTIITSHMGAERDGDPFVRRVGHSCVLLSNGSFARITIGWRLGRTIETLLKEGRFDIVHVHGALAPTLGLVAPAAAHRLDIPVVATFHSWFKRSLGYRAFRRPLQRRLDRIAAKIAVSEPAVRALSRYFQADWEIIPNGVSTEVFHPNGRQPTDALSEKPRLLFLGRLDPRNGLGTVLKAIPAIVERYPNAELVVAGDGPLRPLYERQGRRPGCNVRFVGRVYEERTDYYAGSDLYVCATNRASFGITLLEAMACRTPIVASDITGFRELVDGGDEAVLVQADDPAAWARTVIGLIGDPARRAAMGEAGLKKATGYSWSSIAARVLQTYERVLR